VKSNHKQGERGSIEEKGHDRFAEVGFHGWLYLIKTKIPKAGEWLSICQSDLAKSQMQNTISEI
jgi:hypothetical protein